jgi:hypothetical protein
MPNTELQCQTQRINDDRTGEAEVKVQISDDVHTISSSFSIRAVHPPFRIHPHIAVFAAASPATVLEIPNAVFGLWRMPCVVIPYAVGHFVFSAENADGQLKCEPRAADVDQHRCRCVDHPHTAQEFAVVVDNSDLIVDAWVSNGTLLLKTSSVPLLSGKSRVRVTLLDDGDRQTTNVTYYAETMLEVRHVNQAPSFQYRRSMTVKENENCQENEGWARLGSNMSRISPVGCRHTITAVAWGLAAGQFPERCLNCGQGIVSETTSFLELLSVQQRVTFRVEHISDPAFFETLPHLSVEGVLSFALLPEASGDVQIFVRLVDDGSFNGEPSKAQGSLALGFSVECYTDIADPCGPAAGAAQRREDNGTDVSEVAVITITVPTVNQVPSFLLDRQVVCLDPLNTCSCPSSTSPLQENSACMSIAKDLASITILENSGPHHVHAFVRQMSAGDSAQNQIAVFGFELEDNDKLEEDFQYPIGVRTRKDPSGEGNLTFLEMRADPQFEELEAAVDFDISPDGKHKYVAEFNSNTIAVLDRSNGDSSMKYLDRLRDGQNRVRFYHSESFTTQNPCSGKILENDNETFMAVMQGCEVLFNNLEYLPSYVGGDTYGLHSKSEEYGYLGPRVKRTGISARNNSTKGYWKFESAFMRGLHNTTISYPCCGEGGMQPSLFAGVPSSCPSTEYMNYINPGLLIESTGNFPPARMDQDTCRFQTYHDTAPGQQPSLLTYLTNDGVTEALNFDPVLQQGLWVSRDTTELPEHLLPTRQISVEVWFTIETPFDLLGSKLDTAGLVCASSGKFGWDLSYSLQKGDSPESNPKVQIEWSMSLNQISDDGSKFSPTYPEQWSNTPSLIEDFKYSKWYHVVATFDGLNGTIFVDGIKRASKQTCECPVLDTPPNRQPLLKCNLKQPPPCSIRMARACSTSPWICMPEWNVSAPLSCTGPSTCLRDGVQSKFEVIKGEVFPHLGEFILGAGGKHLNPTARTHSGQIASIRILDVVMTAEEISAAHTLRKDNLRFKVPSDTYWTKAYGKGLIPSPSAMHADATESINISLMGRFNMERTYSCRWRHRDKFVDSAGKLGFAMTLNSTDTDPFEICDKVKVGAELKCVLPTDDIFYKQQNTFQDKYYYNQLTCPTPRWGYGYKAATLSVIENGPEGRIPLWQRTCVRSNFQKVAGSDPCNHISYIDVKKNVETVHNYGKEYILRQPWYLSGLSSFSPSSWSDPSTAHSFGQNRGDFTYFTFTTKSWLQKINRQGALTNRVLNFPIETVLGASKIEFIKLSSSSDTLVAVANFWDGLSTHTNSVIGRLNLLDNSTTSADDTQDSTTSNLFQLIQSIPTQGATGFAHFSLTEDHLDKGVNDTVLKALDYLAVANYGTNTKIYRLSNLRSITAISISRPGTGYIPGIINILSEMGNGFLAYTDTSDSGQIVCNPTQKAECARIMNKGHGFEAETTMPMSAGETQLSGSDLKCTPTSCDLLRKDTNCSLSQEPVCSSIKVRGQVDIHYDVGCARDDSSCTKTRMTDTITSMMLMIGENSTLRGHTSKCFSPGTIFHDNSKRQGSTSLRVEYQVHVQSSFACYPGRSMDCSSSTAARAGSIRSLEFPDASSHGSMYETNPRLILSDKNCSCGTSITRFNVMYGGQGYTSGIITMSGKPNMQAPAAGSDFLSEYWSRGNISEIEVLDSGAGFTTAPRIIITNNGDNPEGKDGAGVQAIGILHLSKVLLLKPGANFLYRPTVMIESPKALGGRRAQATATMEEDWDKSLHATAGNRFRIKEITLTDPGLGYTSLPKVFFIDHPMEDPGRYNNDTHDASKATPQAIAVLKLDKVLVNHDYSLYSPAFRSMPEMILHELNRKLWFPLRRQNEKYFQRPSSDRTDLLGVLVSIRIFYLHIWS